MERQPTVFLVDEDAGTWEVVRELSALLNVGCETFRSGRDFVESLDASRPGCVLLEVRIPGLNGLEVQRHLTAAGVTWPVVFLAGRATVSVAVQAMRNGAVHFLEKPVREHDLWDAVQEAIRLDEERRRLRERREILDARLGRLSEGQHALLQMIADGKTNREIAGELRRCVRTIEKRRCRLMEELGVRSPSELLYLAVHARNGGRWPVNGNGRWEARPNGRERLSHGLEALGGPSFAAARL